MSEKMGEMNLIFTRSKLERLKVCWEPCATSTPMKVVPNSENVKYNLQKQQKINTEPPQCVNQPQKKYSKTSDLLKKTTRLKPLPANKTKKLKSSAFIEISSSSDEESSSESKVRPIIKLSSAKRRHSLFLNKNLWSGVANKNPENKIEEIDISIKSRASNLDLKSGNILISENKSISSSDEQINIFDKSKPTKSFISCVGNKINQVNDSGNKETSTCLNNCSKTKTRKQNVESKIKLKLPKPTPNISNYVSEDLENNEKAISESHNLFKPLKRKNKNTVHKINSVKKGKSRKVNDDFAAHIGNVQAKKPVTPVPVFKNKLNQSHQLFSGTKEQECINSLDLTSTSVEDNEITQNKCFMWQVKNTLPCASYISPHPSSENISMNVKINSKRSKRPKEDCMKVCHKSKPLKKTLSNSDENKQLKPGVSLAENDAKKQSLLVEPNKAVKCADKNNRNRVKKIKEENEKRERKTSVKIVTKRKAFCAAKKVLNMSGDVKDSNQKFSCSGSSSSSDVNENPESNKFSMVSGNEQKVSTEIPEFKLLKEFSIKKKATECSVFECWSVKTFKCGVFKLKIKCQMSCKTLHHNSYLGGVLIKGNLKMKIGKKEQELTEGDMAFVPPFTEWVATNIGECESVFYYWCGRFNS